MFAHGGARIMYVWLVETHCTPEKAGRNVAINVDNILHWVHHKW